ncbi:hypothetical protein LIPSTDRAFT_149591 [Lipomyces starkeyi NRRL Y-11557]|uniref:Uncharacterized protein n=1 Tax=Lipomyces starkeyi NRRL Y-11557 TaxID=675824 RepID=A0A1E3Q2E1_LIPST|nr:hypothetical protein LIPSTDRAFT_149591 [Lipomyces starkeyi NRRL Y-11557]
MCFLYWHSFRIYSLSESVKVARIAQPILVLFDIIAFIKCLCHLLMLMILSFLLAVRMECTLTDARVLLRPQPQVWETPF